MIPTAELQIVVWLEDVAGNYVETLYISRLTGTYGLGNRPGIMEFNSAWRWPYGRRISTFPVWAHRHGMEWPLVVFQDGNDNNLSHQLGQSSAESFYCRPLKEGEAAWDAQSCASTVYTDKGAFSATETSNYPPRSDLVAGDPVDSNDVARFSSLNPFDSVSRATPPGGEPFRVGWKIPENLPAGEYVVWVEVAKEFDQNAFYDYPAPLAISYSEYGLPYRGQPSVVYRVPIAIATEETIAMTVDYAGYGDPDGASGMLFAPDTTITTGTPGSGASRLLLVDEGDEMYRVKVAARPSADEQRPGEVTQLEVLDVTQSGALVELVAPGDDGETGLISGYDVRLSAGEPITEDNFEDMTPAPVTLAPAAPGTKQSFEVQEMLPSTNYYLAIRAYDECKNVGPVATFQITTPQRENGTVDACFVATAAYGSLMAADVHMLRQFRDRYLRSNVAGELLVEAYYTFGPSLAQVVGESEGLRRLARAGLAPLVDAVGVLP